MTTKINQEVLLHFVILWKINVVQDLMFLLLQNVPANLKVIKFHKVYYVYSLSFHTITP